MAAEPTTESTEAEALRARIDALEREQHERTARANAALAAAQDRSYWLDRWNLDLNALMRRRGAGEFRAGAAGAARGSTALRHRTTASSRTLGPRQAARRPAPVEEERAPRRGRARRPLRAHALARPARAPRPVTELLYARLEPEDVPAIEQRLEPAEAALLGDGRRAATAGA